MCSDRQFLSGDECPACKHGRMVVYHSHVQSRAGEDVHRVQFLWCNRSDCRHIPPKNKVIAPLKFFPRRRPRIEPNRPNMGRMLF